MRRGLVMYKKVRMLFGLTLAMILTACNAKGIDSTDNALAMEIQNVQEKETQVLTEEENINSKDNEIWPDSLEEYDEGKRRTNSRIEVSVERVSKPIINDDGQILATVYYERPVLSGDSAVAKKINQFFEQEEQDWFEGRASRLTLYNEDYFSDFKEGVDTICELYKDEETLVNWMRYAVDTWIVLLDDDLLSVVQITNVYVAHCNWHYFGTTFDLETGDLVPIDSLIDITPEKMKKIIEDTSEPVTETYDELKDDNYIIHYYGTEVAMNYEYFYDGKNYFIIINRGDERFVDGEVIEWNGKWGDEYDMTFFRYSVNPQNGKLIVTDLI